MISSEIFFFVFTFSQTSSGTGKESSKRVESESLPISISFFRFVKKPIARKDAGPGLDSVEIRSCESQRGNTDAEIGKGDPGRRVDAGIRGEGSGAKGVAKSNEGE